MVGVGRDLCGSSSPTSLLKQGHLEQADDCVHSLQLYFHKLKGNLAEISCRLSFFLDLAMMNRGQVAPTIMCLRLVPFVEVCWCWRWPMIGGQTLPWSFLCTPNFPDLSGYHQDHMLEKVPLQVHRIKLLLGIHA